MPIEQASPIEVGVCTGQQLLLQATSSEQLSQVMLRTEAHETPSLFSSSSRRHCLQSQSIIVGTLYVL